MNITVVNENDVLDLQLQGTPVFGKNPNFFINTDKDIKMKDVTPQKIIQVALINLLGNTGKTTIARNLLKPLEKFNFNNSVDFKIFDISADKCAVILCDDYEDCSKIDDEEKKQWLKSLDYVLVPTGQANDYTQKNTLDSIKLLIDKGIAPKKLKVIFNFVDNVESIEEDYHLLCEGLRQCGIEVDTSLYLPNLDHNILSNEHDIEFFAFHAQTMPLRDNAKLAIEHFNQLSRGLDLV